jgi:tetratricopeptide (TPR) repeat protein/TolB-like protein
MSPHAQPQWLERIGRTRLGAVLLGYLATAWLVAEVCENLERSFHFPDWFMPIVWVLLAIGLVVVMATALVQSIPATDTAPPVGAGEPGTGRPLPEREGLLQRLLRLFPWLGRVTIGRSILAGVGAFAVLFVLSALIHDDDTGKGAGGTRTLAVLPFRVVGPQFDYLRDGMVDLLSPGLRGADSLQVVSADSVLDVWHSHAGDAAATTRDEALRVARELGVTHVLMGSVTSLAREVHLKGQVYEVRTGKSIGQAEVSGDADSINALVERFAAAVRGTLPGPGRAPDDKTAPPVAPPGVETASAPALKAFLEGEERYRKADFDGALAAYQRALQSDSTFAMALYRLQVISGWMETQPPDSAQRFLERAARAADKLPPDKALFVRGRLAYSSNISQGLAMLNEAVKAYPKDPEAWYFLGDAYYHAGPTVATGLGEAERALSRAVAIDSSFAPAYIHLIQISFTEHADSAQAARLIGAYARVSADSSLDEIHRTALALAFGDSATQSATLAAMDTLPFQIAGAVPGYLYNPRLWGVWERALTVLRDRPEVGEIEGDDRTAGLVYMALSRGRLRTAWKELEDRRLSSLRRAELVYAAFMDSLPVPAELLQRTLSLSSIPRDRDFRNFYAGAYAVDRGRWSEAEEAVSRLESDGRRFRGEDNDWNAGMAFTGAQGLGGYLDWRRGQVEEGFGRLDQAQRQSLGMSLGLSGTLSGWLGAYFLEHHQPADAESVFGINEARSLVALPLARAYEAAGDRERARRFYEWFTITWRDADPELQPRVQQAREALQRLGG